MSLIDSRAVPERMPFAGNPKAPVVVVCDAPNLNQWKAGVPIGGRAFDLWVANAQERGFSADDFVFVSPCAPIPELVEGSDKREKAFVDQYRDCLRATIDACFKHVRLFIFLGKTAGYALTGKPVKITRQRGVVRLADNLSHPVLPLFSPGFVLRRPENMEIFEADMNMLRILREGGWRIDAAALAIDAVDYQWRDDISDLIDLHPGAISVDTEGKGLSWYAPETKLYTVQFAWAEGRAVCVPLINWENNPYGAMSDRRLAKLRGQVKTILEDRTIRKAAHQCKHDHHMLRREGFRVAGWSVDTLLLAFFADENMQEKSQDECVRRWVPALSGYADAFNADPVHVGKSCMERVPPDRLLTYAAGDADANFRLAKRLVAIVQADPKQWTCYCRVQWPAMRAFMDVVEPAGIKINTGELASLQATLTISAETEYQELIAMVPAAVKRRHLAGLKPGADPREALSFSRDQFVRDVLFTKEGFSLKPVVFTPTTRKLAPQEQIPSVSTKQHLPYFDDHPFIPKLIRYQQIAKLQNTYVGIPAHEAINARGEVYSIAATGFWRYLDDDGFIHPNFMLHRTVTGRSASQNPNGQNFPKRGPLAKAYRKIFMARPGYTLVESDYSQAEIRIAAWMAHEKTMLDIYQRGEDIHMATAVIVSRLSKEAFAELPKDTKKAYRQKAKAVVFGFIYGMGWRKFMAYAKTDYGVVFSEKEAKTLRFEFFRTYKGLEPWHQRMRELVRGQGVVRAVHGAMRHLPNIRSTEEFIRSECERQAINSPVQRTGSDLGLMAMGRLCRDADPNLLRPIAFIHDALVVEVRDDYVDEGARAIKFYLESNPLEPWFGLTPPLPITADVSIGPNLSEMEERTDVAAEAPSWWRWDLDGHAARPRSLVLADA